MTKHYVVIIPGLGDESTKIRLATYHWRLLGLTPIVHRIWWKNHGNHFAPKLGRLVTLIDKLSKGGNKVSLVGTSAGGSAVLNAFVKKKNKISKTVSVCGALKKSREKGFRSFEKRTAESPAFGESITMFEKLEPSLTKKDRKQIMTIRALFDELVPGNCAQVKGADNRQIFSAEHVFSIWMSLSFYKPLTDFLKL